MQHAQAMAQALGHLARSRSDSAVEIVVLEARSHKGKNRLANLRQALPVDASLDWEVLATQSTVLFSEKVGPWLHVRPRAVPAAVANRHSRWVHRTADRDFAVCPTQS